MREIRTHKCGRLNDCIVVEAAEPHEEDGRNGRFESHAYVISGVQGPLDHHPIKTVAIKFQNGPLEEVGANGVSDESLLAVLIDRIQGFQKGKFSCRENAIALTHLEDAMHWLQHRTRERIARGVEGTHQK